MVVLPFAYFSICPYRILKFTLCRFCTFFATFIPRYFKTFFLLLQVRSFLYKNKTGSCTLTIDIWRALNICNKLLRVMPWLVLGFNNSFAIHCVGVSWVTIRPFKIIILFPLFSFLWHFFFLFCYIVYFWICIYIYIYSKIALNSSWCNGHLYFVSHFTENMYSFPPLSRTRLWGFR